ncbi:MAG: hypothetical protein KC496_18970, partial [Anaerolineae bacterium]|nr:hypothetical protein [Anaerolineae bacterium]
VRTWFWARHQGAERIVYADQTRNWYVFDQTNGIAEPLLAPPMLVREGGNMDAVLTPLLQDVNTSPGVVWQFFYNGTTVQLPYEAYNVGLGLGMDPVLSADGSRVAWSEFGTVRIWNGQNQTVQTILQDDQPGGAVNVGPFSVAWSPMMWVTNGSVGGTPTPTPVIPTGACSLPTRLEVGMTVEVAPGQEPNRVRTQPALSAPRTGLIFPGEVAVLQEGPVCADGLNWWRISWSGTDGWTAEGADGVYWLVPSN